MLAVTAGSQFTCPMVDKIVNGSVFQFGLQPAFSFTGYPETTDVQVRCNTADANGCNDWYIDPINLGAAVARLMETTTVGKKQQTTDEGDFYMRFHIHVTRPQRRGGDEC
jgi:hypothetical protein